MPLVRTPRLLLEPLDDGHADGLQQINGDPAVMRHITGVPCTLKDTQDMISRARAAWSTRGFSWWAIRRRQEGDLIGACCIQPLMDEPSKPFEIGWRLRPDVWGMGYASEAARHAVGWAFSALCAPSVWAVCSLENKASVSVMERLGMAYLRRGRWYDTDGYCYHLTASAWQTSEARQQYDLERREEHLREGN